jgi:hypothetical protein
VREAVLRVAEEESRGEAVKRWDASFKYMAQMHLAIDLLDFRTRARI